MGLYALLACAVLVLLAAGVWFLLRLGGFVGSAEDRSGSEPPAPRRTEDLRFSVPEGHNPGTVLTALDLRGYDAVLEDNDQVVVVACPRSREHHRELVRGVIASVYATSGDGPADRSTVRFEDEPTH